MRGVYGRVDRLKGRIGYLYIIQKEHRDTHPVRILNLSRSIPEAGSASELRQYQFGVGPINAYTHHSVQCLRVLIRENEDIAAKESAEPFPTLCLHDYTLLQKPPWSHVSSRRSKIKSATSPSEW